MNQTNNAQWKRLAAGMAVFLAFLAAGLTQRGSAQPEHRMSKKEVMELIAKATTKEDHQMLATHYRRETERLLAEAKEHEEMAAMYRRSPPPLASKHPASVGDQHCRDIARRYREAAAKMQALATLHEELAKKAAK